MASAPEEEKYTQVFRNVADELSCELDKEAIIQSFKFDDGIAACSICGPKDSGKSLLFQLLIDYFTYDDVQSFKTHLENDFEFCGKLNTDGILISKKSFSFRGDKTHSTQRVNVFLMDTQGLPMEPVESKRPKFVVELSAVMSHVLIYNVKEKLHESDIKNLKVFIDFGHRLRETRQATTLKKLLFLIRDAGGTEYGIAGGKKYMSHFWRKFRLNPKQSKEGLEAAFEEVNCFLMPNISPKEPEQGLKGLDARFVEEFCEMTQFLFKDVLKLNPLYHKWLDGHEYCRRYLEWAETLQENRDEIGNLLLKNCKLDEYYRLLGNSVDVYTDSMETHIRTVSPETDYDHVHNKSLKVVETELQNVPEEVKNSSRWALRSKDYKRRLSFKEAEYKKMFETRQNQLSKRLGVKQKTNFDTAVEIFEEAMETIDWPHDSAFHEIQRHARDVTIRHYINCFTAKERALAAFTRNLGLLEDKLEQIQYHRWCTIKQFSHDIKYRFDIYLRMCVDLYQEVMNEICNKWMEPEQIEKHHNDAVVAICRRFTEVTESISKYPVFDSYCEDLKHEVMLIRKCYFIKNEQYEDEFRSRFEKKMKDIINNYNKFLMDRSDQLTSHEKFCTEEAIAAQKAHKDFEESCKFGVEINWMFNSYFTKLKNEELPAQKEKLWKEIEKRNTEKGKIKILLLECMHLYKTAILEGLKGNDPLFKNVHQKGLQNAKEFLMQSKFWKDEKSQKNVESMLNKRIEEESDHLEIFLKNKMEIKLLKGMKQISVKYEELMDRGLSAADTNDDFDSLHDSSSSAAMLKSGIGKKVIKENPEIKRNLKLSKERFRQIFEMRTSMQAMSSNMETLEFQKNDGSMTMTSFLSPSELLCSRGNIVGEGRISTVRRAFHKLHEEVVVKCRKIDGDQEEIQTCLKSITHSIEILNINGHINLSRTIGYTLWRGHIGAVSEYMAGGQLATLLTEQRGDFFRIPHIAATLKLRFCADIASALAFLRARPRLPVSQPRIDDVMLTSELRCKLVTFKFSNLEGGDGVRGDVSGGVLGPMLAVVMSRNLNPSFGKNKPLRDASANKQDRKVMESMDVVVQRCMDGAEPSQVRDTLVKMLPAGNAGMLQEVAKVARGIQNQRSTICDQQLIPVYRA